MIVFATEVGKEIVRAIVITVLAMGVEKATRKAKKRAWIAW